MYTNYYDVPIVLYNSLVWRGLGSNISTVEMIMYRCQRILGIFSPSDTVIGAHCLQRQPYTGVAQLFSPNCSFRHILNVVHFLAKVWLVTCCRWCIFYVLYGSGKSSVLKFYLCCGVVWKWTHLSVLTFTLGAYITYVLLVSLQWCLCNGQVFYCQLFSWNKYLVSLAASVLYLEEVWL